MSDPKPPRAFISYSWTSPDHEEWVVRLATDLMENGVEVVLDKWDLREGDDKYAFMERMVTDPTVDKVIAICDAAYAAKADGRAGGVGTETQIMSKEVYEQVDSADRPQKFVAVVVESDEQDSPCVPAFLAGRIHIDMTDEELWAERFEQLLRWLFGKPVYQKPTLGSPPTYVLDRKGPALGTSAKQRRAIDMLRQHKPHAISAAEDFFETFATGIEQTRVAPQPRETLDQRLMDAIEASLPFRDEVIDLFVALARYATDDGELSGTLRRFLEQVNPLAYWPEGIDSWVDGQADNFAFLNQELFLYCLASLLKVERFESVNDLIAQDYYFPPGSPRVRDRMVSFSTFNCHLHAVQRYNATQAKQQWLSPTGQLMRERSHRTDLRFDDLMQADFLLYVRGLLRDNGWWPNTLVYASRFHDQPLEVFARSQSAAYFDRAKIAIGVESADDLSALIRKMLDGTIRLPSWEVDSFHPGVLAGIERIASLP